MAHRPSNAASSARWAHPRCVLARAVPETARLAVVRPLSLSSCLSRWPCAAGATCLPQAVQRTPRADSARPHGDPNTARRSPSCRDQGTPRRNATTAWCTWKRDQTTIFNPSAGGAPRALIPMSCIPKQVCMVNASMGYCDLLYRITVRLLYSFATERPTLGKNRLRYVVGITPSGWSCAPGRCSVERPRSDGRRSE